MDIPTPTLSKHPSHSHESKRPLPESELFKRGMTLNPIGLQLSAEPPAYNPFSADSQDFAGNRIAVHEEAKDLNRIMEHSNSSFGSDSEERPKIVRQQALRVMPTKRFKRNSSKGLMSQISEERYYFIGLDPSERLTQIIKDRGGRFSLSDINQGRQEHEADEEDLSISLDQEEAKSDSSSYFSFRTEEEEDIEPEPSYTRQVSRFRVDEQERDSLDNELLSDQHDESTHQILTSQPTVAPKFSHSTTKQHTQKLDHHGLLLRKEAMKLTKVKVKKCSQNLVIPRGHWAFKMWQMLQFVVNFSSAFYFVYVLAFFHHLDERRIQGVSQVDLGFSTLFLIDLGVHLIKEKTIPHSKRVERELPNLIKMRMTWRTLLDALTMLPFFWIAKTVGFPSFLTRVLLFGKMTRIEKAFMLFSSKKFKHYLKVLQAFQLSKRLQHSRKEGQSRATTSSNLGLILFLAKVHQAVRMVLLILCLSYFTGLIFLSMSRGIGPSEWLEKDSFTSAYDLEDYSEYRVVVAMTYYLFTSFSTVGLGDLTPRNSGERIMVAFILLFGVMITSLIMDNFNGMIKEIRDFDASFEESEGLALFFGTLSRVNNDTKIAPALEHRLEAYFAYRWDNDRRIAFLSEEDKLLFDKLPDKIQRLMFTDYLFTDFLELHHSIFQVTTKMKRLTQLKRRQFMQLTTAIGNQLNEEATAHLDWTNEEYQAFVVGFLASLEPKFLDKSVIQKQNALVDEMMFSVKADFEVGYNHEYFLIQHGIVQPIVEIERQETHSHIRRTLSIKTKLEKKRLHFPFKQKAGQPIGMYEMLLEQPSQFIYRLSKAFEGTSQDFLFVRKKAWKQLASGIARDLIENFKSRVLLNYLDKVYLPLKEYQDKMLLMERRKQEPDNRIKNILTLFGQKLVTSQESQPPLSVYSKSINFEESLSEEENSADSERVDHKIDRDRLLSMVQQKKLTKKQRNLIRRIVTNLDEVSEKAEIETSFKQVAASLEEVIDLCEGLIDENELLRVKLRDKDEEIERLRNLASGLNEQPRISLSPISPTPSFKNTTDQKRETAKFNQPPIDPSAFTLAVDQGRRGDSLGEGQNFFARQEISSSSSSELSRAEPVKVTQMSSARRPSRSSSSSSSGVIKIGAEQAEDQHSDELSKCSRASHASRASRRSHSPSATSQSSRRLSGRQQSGRQLSGRQHSGRQHSGRQQSSHRRSSQQHRKKQGHMPIHHR